MMISSSTMRILAVAMRLPPFLVLEFRKRDGEGRACVGADLDLALKLLGQVRDQLEAQRLAPPPVEVPGQPGPAVPHAQDVPLVLRRMEADPDLARAARREGVLEGVGHQLVDDESAGDGRVDAEPGA